MKIAESARHDLEVARTKWLEANERATQVASEMFIEGTGYGDPDARVYAEHRLASSRSDADRYFREYHDLERRDMEHKLLEIQRSQRLATWASFAVAAVVGVATVISTLVSMFG